MKQLQAKIASALIILIIIGSMFAIGVDAVQNGISGSNSTTTAQVTTETAMQDLLAR